MVIAVALLLAGCSRGLSGSYADAMGASRYDFQRDGTVAIRVGGVTRQASYQRVDDQLRITVDEAGAPLEFAIDPDGSLVGPLGVRLHRARD